MAVDDREVLEFLGRQGKMADQIRERFADFDVMRLIRAGLVEVKHIDQPEAQAHGVSTSPAFQSFYALTKRGAEAIGIDPDTLHMA